MIPQQSSSAVGGLPKRFYNANVPDFSDMLVKERLVDVQFVTSNGKRVWAHRSRLSSLSPLLAALFASDNSEKSVVLLPDVSYETCRLLIHFLYTGFMRATKSEVEDILTAARILGIRPAIDVEDPFGGCSRSSKRQSEDSARTWKKPRMQSTILIHDNDGLEQENQARRSNHSSFRSVQLPSLGVQQKTARKKTAQEKPAQEQSAPQEKAAPLRPVHDKPAQQKRECLRRTSLLRQTLSAALENALFRVPSARPRVQQNASSQSTPSVTTKERLHQSKNDQNPPQKLKHKKPSGVAKKSSVQKIPVPVELTSHQPSPQETSLGISSDAPVSLTQQAEKLQENGEHSQNENMENLQNLLADEGPSQIPNPPAVPPLLEDIEQTPLSQDLHPRLQERKDDLAETSATEITTTPQQKSGEVIQNESAELSLQTTASAVTTPRIMIRTVASLLSTQEETPSTATSSMTQEQSSTALSMMEGQSQLPNLPTESEEQLNKDMMSLDSTMETEPEDQTASPIVSNLMSENTHPHSSERGCLTESQQQWPEMNSSQVITTTTSSLAPESTPNIATPPVVQQTMLGISSENTIMQRTVQLVPSEVSAASITTSGSTTAEPALDAETLNLTGSGQSATTIESSPTSSRSLGSMGRTVQSALAGLLQWKTSKSTKTLPQIQTSSAQEEAKNADSSENQSGTTEPNESC